jgi:UPF0042 nucleotide-binding protein
MSAKKFITLVTGLSGGGKSEALRCFEDMGYEAIDNMPLRLIPALLSDIDTLPDKLALGMDVRNHDITTHYEEAIAMIRENPEIQSHMVFLHADNDELLRRFNTTRRKHPLAVGRPLSESIGLERQVLTPLQKMADSEIDTTGMSPTDMWRIISTKFMKGKDAGMQIFVMSFGFKYGLPREVDMVMDMRFLKNPHWDESLRHMTGLEESIIKYVTSDAEYSTTFGNIQTLLNHQLAQFAKADRSYVNVAFGCTGGKHRSVVVTQQMGASLKASGFKVKIHHRDIERAES